MDDLKKLLLTSNYVDKTCIYYPKILSHNDLFGDISIDHSEWEKLQKNFVKYHKNHIFQTVYTYHDLELVIKLMPQQSKFDKSDYRKLTRSYYLCTQSYCKICENKRSMINIIQRMIINQERFPIISGYDKIVDQEILSYECDGVTISFIKENDITTNSSMKNDEYYYCYISFMINKTNNEIKRIEKIISLFD